MRIVVLDGFLVREGIKSWVLDEKFDVIWYDETPPAQVLSRIGDAQAVFVNRTPLPAYVFSACPTLQFVGVFGTGYNLIDINAAQQAGVVVCNVPEYSSDAVAQHTISLLLTIACQTSAHNQFIKAGEWRSLSDPPLIGRCAFELRGKTIGLIGYGNIAQAVSKIALAFGMSVLAYCRHPKQAILTPGVCFCSLDQLFSKSDVISLHCPLTDETREMINADSINQMKSGVVLLNTARGGLCNENDVLHALDDGQIWMAGLDVFGEEPVRSNHPLAFHKKVIATPHVAWTPDETRARLLQISAQNLLCFLEGKPQNVVNKR